MKKNLQHFKRTWGFTPGAIIFTVFVPVLISCRTAKTVVVPSVSHDTVYISQQHYDSIYIFDGIVPNDSTALAKLLPQQSALLKIAPHRKTGDLAYSSPGGGGREGALVHVEYRYKLLRDTMYVNKVDTIPKLVTVTKTQQAEYTPAIVIVIIIIIVIVTVTAIVKNKFSLVP